MVVVQGREEKIFWRSHVGHLHTSVLAPASLQTPRMDRDATADALQHLSVQDLPQVTEDEGTTNDGGMPPPRVDLPDDTPPAFPAPHSAQRQAAPRADLTPLHTAPSREQKLAAPKLGPPVNSLRRPAGGLQPPTVTSSARLNNPGRKKVALEPGCSPLDWARIKNSTDLRVCVTAYPGWRYLFPPCHALGVETAQFSVGRMDSPGGQSVQYDSLLAFPSWRTGDTDAHRRT